MVSLYPSSEPSRDTLHPGVFQDRASLTPTSAMRGQLRPTEMDDTALIVDITFAEDKAFVEDTAFSKDEAFTEDSTFAKDITFVEDATFTKDKAFAEDATFTKDKVFVEDTTFAKDTTFAEDTTFADDITFVEDTDFAEDSAGDDTASTAGSSASEASASTAATTVVEDEGLDTSEAPQRFRLPYGFLPAYNALNHAYMRLYPLPASNRYSNVLARTYGKTEYFARVAREYGDFTGPDTIVTIVLYLRLANWARKAAAVEALAGSDRVWDLCAMARHALAVSDAIQRRYVAVHYSSDAEAVELIHALVLDREAHVLGDYNPRQ
ncbi:unnamed protein product [Cutaneotrichosporon oleaginosum]